MEVIIIIIMIIIVNFPVDSIINWAENEELRQNFSRKLSSKLNFTNYHVKGKILFRSENVKDKKC